MQNFILITLVLGLSFFLYLIGSGEIDPAMFNITKLQGDVRFEVSKADADQPGNSATLNLVVKDTPYIIYSFSGMEFKHIPKTEYYMDIYRVPLEAKDAVTGIWLGSRYVFYVTEELINGSELDLAYHIYKAEYPTDSTDPVTYIPYRTVKSLDGASGKFEVRY